MNLEGTPTEPVTVQCADCRRWIARGTTCQRCWPGHPDPVPEGEHSAADAPPVRRCTVATCPCTSSADGGRSCYRCGAPMMKEFAGAREALTRRQKAYAPSSAIDAALARHAAATSAAPALPLELVAADALEEAEDALLDVARGTASYHDLTVALTSIAAILRGGLGDDHDDAA